MNGYYLIKKNNEFVYPSVKFSEYGEEIGKRRSSDINKITLVITTQLDKFDEELFETCYKKSNKIQTTLHNTLPRIRFKYIEMEKTYQSTYDIHDPLSNLVIYSKKMETKLIKFQVKRRLGKIYQIENHKMMFKIKKINITIIL